MAGRVAGIGGEYDGGAAGYLGGNEVGVNRVAIDRRKRNGNRRELKVKSIVFLSHQESLLMGQDLDTHTAK